MSDGVAATNAAEWVRIAREQGIRAELLMPEVRPNEPLTRSPDAPQLSGAQRDLAAKIDHTALHASTTAEDVVMLCQEAIDYGFASVCVNPMWVPLAAGCIGPDAVPPVVCTVIGFPLGASATSTKIEETRIAIEQGAREIDMVIPIGPATMGRWEPVAADIAAVVDAARSITREPRVIVKVILETAMFRMENQIITACEIAKAAGADFVKTSTGFGPGGATTEAVALMAKTVGGQLGIKASGGIRTPESAAEMIAAGATRIGASDGIKLLGIDPPVTL